MADNCKGEYNHADLVRELHGIFQQHPDDFLEHGRKYIEERIGRYNHTQITEKIAELMNLQKPFIEKNDFANKYLDELLGEIERAESKMPVFDRYTIYGHYIFIEDGKKIISPYFIYIRSPEERKKGMIGFTVGSDSIAGRALLTEKSQISSKQDPNYDRSPVKWSGEDIGDYISTFPLFYRERIYSAIQFMTNKKPDKDIIGLFEHLSKIVYAPYIFYEMMNTGLDIELHTLKNKVTEVHSGLLTIDSCLKHASSFESSEKLLDAIRDNIGFAINATSVVPAICQKLTLDKIYTLIARNKTSMNIIVEKVEKQLSDLRKATGLDVNIHLELGEMPYQKLAEDELVSKVFGNLVRNSSEAAAEKGIKPFDIVFKTYLTEDKVPGIYYKDNAGGMSQEMLEKMFEPGMSAKGMGRGIGMFTTARIVAMEKGHIRAASTEGEGTEFWIEIPVSL